MKENIYKFLKILRTKGLGAAMIATKHHIREQMVPPFVLIIAYPIYSFIHPQMSYGFISLSGDIYKVINCTGNDFYIPKLSTNLYNLSDLESGATPESISHNLRKYSFDDDISPSSCDYIIDIGAFIGAVSIGVAKEAKKVISVEPSKRNAECIRKNAQEFGVEDKIVVVEKPVYNKKTNMSFNLSHDPTDNSLISTDTSHVRSEQIETTTIDIIALEHSLARIDFLKMDAEGVEPEVLLGAQNTHISQVAIDCSAERDGESSYKKIYNILTNNGYETRRANQKDGWDVVYGKLVE